MAKRGYRGKHPYNDMKVASGENTAANSAKLTTEYNKIGAKQKYDFIKSHDGFNPKGTATIHFGGAATDGETITIVSTDGTSKAYVAENGSPTLTQDPAEFDMSGTAAANATSLAAAINAPKIAAVKATASDAIDTNGHTAATGDSTFTLALS